MQKQNVQRRCAFGAKLAVEDKHRLLRCVSTAAGGGLVDIVVPEEIFLNLFRSVDIHRALNMPALEFILKSTVDNLIRGDRIIELARYQRVQLYDVMINPCEI